MDPLSIGILSAALVLLALIGKSWSAQSRSIAIELAKIRSQRIAATEAKRLEIARVEAQKRNDDLDADLDMALKQAEEALRVARATEDVTVRFDGRLTAVENRTRR